MESLRQDFIYALRFMRKHRGFALLIVLCLALGIGANSAIFSVVDAVLLRPLPYPDADRLAVLLEIHQGAGSAAEEYDVTAADFLAWRAQSHKFETLEAMLARPFNLSGRDGDPERLQGAAATAGLFNLMGAELTMGRGFLAEEDRPGGPRAVVLSHGLWQRRFGGDPQILDRRLELDGESYPVVGVMKPGFRFLSDADLWVPLALDKADPPPQHQLVVAGRLRRKESLETAQSEMRTIAARLARDNPETNAGYTVQVEGLRDNLVRDRRRGLLLLLAAVGLLLLIACANVGNLLLVRAAEQRNEIAVRAAFGASRSRLVRQTLTESVVLALTGAIVGIPIAEGALWLLPRIAPEYAAILRDARLDLRVLAFTVLLSLITGLLPGLLPALKTSTPNLYRRLTSGGGRRSTEGVRGRRVQSGLVVVEVAVALLLLVSAGLMLKSFALINRVELGFDRENVLTAQVSLPDGYSEERTATFWRDLIGGVETLPGVTAAAATTVLPVAESPVTTTFILERRATGAPADTLMANFRRVSPDYFKALGIPVTPGRGFEAGDDGTATPVALVSRDMAKRYWGGQNPVGRRLQRTSEAASGKWLTVVGVVGDVQDSALGAETGATLYVPIAQGARPTMTLVARTQPNVDPLSLVPAVRRRVAELDRTQAIAEVKTLEEHISGTLARRRFHTFMLSLFAGLGMALAVLGVYAVLSYSVSQRGHEIGVRMALGAQGGDVVRLILRRGMGLALLGLILGLAAALLFTRLLEGMLYGVQPTDPIVFAAIAVGLMVVALAASYLPARRAARFDPIVTLRSDY